MKRVLTTAKIELIMRAQKERVPIISAMGAGNKLLILRRLNYCLHMNNAVFITI